jgi:UDP-glucose 4-epimerase
MKEAQRCLVLGGRGFLGSHLVDELLRLGYSVRCFDRPHIKPLGLDHLSNPNFELYEGDFSSETDIAQAVQGVSICFHLISTTLPMSSNADPIFDVESNLLGTVRLLTHAVSSKVTKIIFVSSGGTIYGTPKLVPIDESHSTDPICSYGITKLAIEKYLALFKHLHGLDFTVLRLANPFGQRQRIHSSQGAVAVFLGKVRRGETIDIWGDGSVVRDYIHVADVVKALIASMLPAGNGHIFNIGSGYGTSLNEVLSNIELVVQKKAVRNYLPGRPFDVPASVLSISLAKEILGWSPTVGFEPGLRLFNNWLEQNKDLA